MSVDEEIAEKYRLELRSLYDIKYKEIEKKLFNLSNSDKK